MMYAKAMQRQDEAGGGGEVGRGRARQDYIYGKL